MKRSRPPAAVVAIAVLLVVLGACTAEAPVASNTVPPPATAGERVSLVTLGGNETVIRGLDESVNQPWNQQVFSELPLSATFANVAARDATVADGLDEQVPKALAEQPTLAIVWFGANDAAQRTGTTAFSNRLTSIVQQLQIGGARVLLIERTGRGPDGIGPYLDAVGRVAAATGATLVTIEAHDDLRNPAEHRAIAEAVAAVL